MRKEKGLGELARARGLSPRTLQDRIKRGWSLERALAARGKTFGFSSKQLQQIKSSGFKYSTIYACARRPCPTAPRGMTRVPSEGGVV